MDPQNQPVQPQEPIQNLNQTSQNINQQIQPNTQDQRNFQSPENKSGEKTKLILIAAILIVIFAFIISLLIIISIRSDALSLGQNRAVNEKKVQLESNLNNDLSVDTILNKEIEITDLSTNKKIDFIDDTIAYCMTKEAGLEEDIIVVYFGDYDAGNDLEDNFWSFSAYVSDIKSKKEFDLPTKIISGKYDEPSFTVAVFNEEEDYDGYNSGDAGASGKIYINEFEGCVPGKKFSFSIDGILMNVDSEKKDQKLKVIGTYNNEFTNDFSIENSGQEYEESIADRNNRMRQTAVIQILNAVGAYKADNRGQVPSGITPLSKQISSDGADLCDDLLDSYIPALPSDPLAANGGEYILPKDCKRNYNTEFTISIDAEERVTVSAPNAEEGKTIKITR